MKKKLYSGFIIISIIILIINIFFKSKTLDESIIFSSNLFIKNIIPSLFPMFVISGILVELNIPYFLSSIFNNIFSKIFKTKAEISFIFFLSMLTGFPSSAKYINDLIDKDIINEKDGEKALLFTFFSNPLFIINTVGVLFFNNIKIGIYILISHVLSNIIIGIIFRNYNKVENNNKVSIINSLKSIHYSLNNKNIFYILLDNIKTSINTLINIYGVITFFIIIINILSNNILITGLFEITSGLKLLSISNIDQNIKILLSCFFISFGGLSIHMQIFSILKEKKIKYLPFLLSRILHGFINIFIIFLLKMGKLF